MTDSMLLTTGNGTSPANGTKIAVDTIDTDKLAQIVKIMLGANGVETDRLRGNEVQTLLASAARTATATTAPVQNTQWRGIALTLNVTANPGGGQTLSLKLQQFANEPADYHDYADAGVVFTAANGRVTLLIYPGVTDADLVAGVIAKNAPCPTQVRAVVTHSGVGSWTYSLSYELIK